ncbi:hypothetical protein [Mariniplasma anaerobium]|uniref:Uncharacterized protein n=1 Tax=Mariniplasma anaerobium TaxID=2735436 RepID=A0A7U9TGX6_9MOLU|nr:hypothetical protein [Mariniplasma anaerobium]BCR36355.1 hypothetical protein MPAN_012480 [Mariniplasma anaerobium]
MNTYRKSLVIQLLMFVVFFVMGANVIISFYVVDTFPAYTYVILGVLVLFGVFGYLYYKRSSNEIAVITPKEFKTLKRLLYSYLFIYIGEMLASGLESLPKDIVAIVFGSLLCIIAIVGVVIQYKILEHK